MEHKVAIVTGANNGIGYESAKAIAKKDHNLNYGRKQKGLLEFNITMTAVQSQVRRNKHHRR